MGEVLWHELKIYNRAFTGTEVSTLFESYQKRNKKDSGDNLRLH